MELEELEPSKPIGPQQDVETVESWADRNGPRVPGQCPTVKPGKRRMVNCPYDQPLSHAVCTSSSRLKTCCYFPSSREETAVDRSFGIR